MSESEDATRGEQALEEGTHLSRRPPASGRVYFLPDQSISERKVREKLAGGPRSERAMIVSNLLCYGLWDDIWSFVDREQVRDLFPHLELPAKLRRAWGRLLGVPPEAAGDATEPTAPRSAG